jgi:hypothetical protein
MVTTLAKQRQKLSMYKLWRARFIILTLRQRIKKLAERLAFLFYKRQKLAFVSIVKQKSQSCAAAQLFNSLKPPQNGFTSDSE